MRLPTQSALFWQEHCATHRRMAEMHREAGNLRLAHDSEQTARARDLAAALDYGEWRAGQSV